VVRGNDLTHLQIRYATRSEAAATPYVMNLEVVRGNRAAKSCCGDRLTKQCQTKLSTSKLWHVCVRSQTADPVAAALC
jgi:hypothetical protein